MRSITAHCVKLFPIPCKMKDIKSTIKRSSSKNVALRMPMILVKFNWVKLWGIPLMAFAEVNVYAVPAIYF